MTKIIKVLKAIAETQRLRILALLSQKELCVCEIQKIIGLSFATVSKHLSILCEANLLTSKKIQKWVIYSIDWLSLDNETKSILDRILKMVKSDEIVQEDLLKLSATSNQRFCLLTPETLSRRKESLK